MLIGQVLFALPLLYEIAGIRLVSFRDCWSGVRRRRDRGDLRDGSTSTFPAPVAAVPALLLVLFPGYLAYATSFMTDVPALAAQFFSLALGARALSRSPVSTRLVAASAAIGFLGFCVRDIAVVAPVAVLVAALLVEPRRREFWAIGLVLGLSCAGLYVWQATLPGQFGEAPNYDGGASGVACR